jgi:hypothetical protein
MGKVTFIRHINIYKQPQFQVLKKGQNWQKCFFAKKNVVLTYLFLHLRPL